MRVYPHVCGATNEAFDGHGTCLGLSPRVWGNQDLEVVRGGAYRSIPTCVGQPRPPEYRRPVATVYPHVCGATFRAPPEGQKVFGLSPRVWGNRCNHPTNP